MRIFVTTIAVRWRCSLQIRPRQTQSRGNKTSQAVRSKENRGWLLATYPRDPTFRAVRSLTIRWGSGSKPQRNKPLIYRRIASRETVSKTTETTDNTPVPPPLRQNPSIYWSGDE
ncbi:hypothetical protein T4A_13096 [Trichinella pseudospiralis]|uniref:Uncharacterized protein n=1 Tax=Trichinella pseudospiralis TaxID=6337 RepID=A0A0V1EEJ7_TRIPS|nr:hypothetical protein T4A_13096 [Trichinella pseudospiralis]